MPGQRRIHHGSSITGRQQDTGQWRSLRFRQGPDGQGRGQPQQVGGEDNWEHARARLEYGLDILRKLGATVDGVVGDPNPAKAISDVLKRRSYDEVALSTLPKGVSRWLGLDIPHQVQRKFHVPVTVISVKRVPS